ncbi:uncharacterized protein LOC5507581 [Nematostella vectensis]|uniref:uncharacterized protein LOC5507581 n=1 Tax=Nematostella vectensis TaxID=45351 RepID=UPI0020776F42|nr:uncharacterized protein LOC5507581 [Nematostella vectensis]
MASRCIEALNELDQISDKIFYKYSKSKMKAEIEAKLRASRCRTGRLSAQSDDATSSSIGSRNSYYCTRHSPASTSTKRNTKSASVDTTKPQKQDRARTTQSCPEKLNSKKKSPRRIETSAEKSSEDGSSCRTKSPSVYGKYVPGREQHEPKPWFNLKEGLGKGVIDSFACDAQKERALCYTIDQKEAKPVPKLLRHRLEVRIGLNGNVKEDESNRNSDVSSANENGSDNKQKSRPAPLSWEEQLNWQNAIIVSPRRPPEKKTEDKVQCETIPVVFNPPPSKPIMSRQSGLNPSTSYRMSLETKRLVSDRGNLTCTEKCITTVELEDVRELAATKHRKEKRASELTDVDKMDMSTTIYNMDRLYSSESARSDCEKGVDRSGSALSKVVEESPRTGEGLREKEDLPKYVLGPDMAERVNKRVSFEDQQKHKAHARKGSLPSKNDLQKSITDQSDFTKLTNPVEKRANTAVENTADSRCTLTRQRPKSSLDRMQIERKSELVEFMNQRTKRQSRPSTAPPCSPRTSIPRSSIPRSPIHVPTSERELTSACESDIALTGESASKTSFALEPKQIEDENDCAETKTASFPNPPPPRVAVSCKSATVARVTPRAKELVTRSKSSSSMSTGGPIVMCAEPIELPKNMAPAQALLELRKKIRDDLAQETADLQLDIQQLYLKHHNYDSK